MSLRDLVLVSGVFVSSVLGCSLIRDLSGEQCDTDGDCVRFGAYECSKDQVCVARAPGTAGSSGAGGDSNGGGGSDGEPSSAGAAGEAPVRECATNADCIALHDGEPYICRDASCIPLTDPDHCPAVIAGPEDNPTEYLTRPGKPIIFGAYVPIGVEDPLGHPYTLNYRFALEEFMDGTLGGVGTPARPFVMVLCQSTNANVAASAAHLIDKVQVPGILAAIQSSDLKALLDYSLASEQKVFLLGPLEADVALASADDQGLMWHMLGPATDLVPAYVPLVEKAQAYVRTSVKGDDKAKLKVAVIHSDDTYSVDMANSLQKVVKVNDHTLTDEANKDYYKRYEVKVNGVKEPDASAVIADLRFGGQNQADIVISLGGDEFIDPILMAIQEGRDDSAETLFYVLSPRNAYNEQLVTDTFFRSASGGLVFKASAGVNYASAEDKSLYNEYLTNIQAKYSLGSQLESRENFYDAAYFMLYSLAAASMTTSGDFDGDDVVNGMKSLTATSSDGKVTTVGPGKEGDMISYVITLLKTGGKVSLQGTLGAPDFNPLTGARNSQGSVWCVDRKESGDFEVRFDAARLDPDRPGDLKVTAPFCFDKFLPAQ